jgi:hypothetical protein
VATLASVFLATLKKIPWLKAVNDHSSKINHIILVLASGAGAIGIGWTWNASAHSLTFTGLDFTAIVGSLWLWWKQWAIQYGVHRVGFGPVAVPNPNAVAPAPKP